MTLGRLKKRAEFLSVGAANRKWVTQGVIVQALPKADTDPEQTLRLGFTVSRKVGNAVKRNRARRRLKEAARQVMGEHSSKPYDLVLIGRSGTLTRSFDDLRGDLRFSLKGLGLIQKRPTSSPPNT